MKPVRKVTSTGAKVLGLIIITAIISIAAYFRLNARRDDKQTITFGEIGRYGRLGNQLFQVASTIGIALSRDMKYSFPERIEESIVGGMFDIRGTITDENLNTARVVREVKEGFYEVEIPSTSPLVSLHGYFQSHWYFFKYNDELRKVLKLKPSIIQNVQAGCPEVQLPNTLGIHMRGTDYLKYPDLYRVLGEHYYKKAVENLHTSSVPIDAIIIAADDKAKAGKLQRSIRKLGLYNVPIVISPFSDPAYDLALLSMCRHLIIANSSFSWWAAYLNMLQSYNGTVFAPSPWYKPDGGLSHLNTLYFYLPHWNVLHEDLLDDSCSGTSSASA